VVAPSLPPFEPAAPLPAGVRPGVDLAPFTTWQVGGPARWFVEPSSVEEVQAAVAWANAHGVAWRPMGRGSNLLVGDGGFEGLIVRLGNAFGQVRIEPAEGHGVVHAQAGVPCAQFVVACNQAGYGGLEPLVGVPGTIGGAVAMNASAHGKAVSEGFLSGRVLRADGALETWAAEEFAFSYRHTRLHEEQVLFLEGTWHLAAVPIEEARARIRELQRWRHEKQPTNLPSGGSTFRNPGEGLPAAGALIEQVGGKGLRLGGAEVSEKHANFIVNRGGATAADINGLIVTLQERVRAKFGVTLVPEVMGLGMHVGTE